MVLTPQNREANPRSIFRLYDLSRITEVFSYPYPFHVFGFCLGYYASAYFGWKLSPLEGEYWPSFHELRTHLENPNLLTLGTPAHFTDWMRFCDKVARFPTPSYTAIIGGEKLENWDNLLKEFRSKFSRGKD